MIMHVIEIKDRVHKDFRCYIIKLMNDVNYISFIREEQEIQKKLGFENNITEGLRQ